MWINSWSNCPMGINNGKKMKCRKSIRPRSSGLLFYPEPVYNSSNDIKANYR